jgi:hypothetical protein
MGHAATIAPQPYHPYAGTSKDGEQVGDPGHCERCLQVGHVTAHPDLGCGDVGCADGHSLQDEPQPVRLKVYVATSPGVDFRTELYGPLRAGLGDMAELFCRNANAADPAFTRAWVQDADVLVVDISGASTEVGIELGWADAFGVPIVAIVRAGEKWSPAAARLSTHGVLTYSEVDELVRYLTWTLPQVGLAGR